MNMTEVIIMIFGLISSVLIAPFYLKWLKQKQFGQYIREEGPKSHKSKMGTPTMGAIIFVVPVLVLFVLFSGLGNNEGYFLFFLFLLYAIIGGIDDFSKISKKQNEGLTSKQKIILQTVVALVLFLVFIVGKIDTSIWIPFGNFEVDLHWVYPIFAILLIIGASNATNLTDGVDGLLAGNAIVSFLTFALIAYIKGNQTILTMSLLLVATLIGFLIFNFNPAKVFMGDMGSLALGAVMAGMAIVLKVEILLILIGIIYVIETLSVIAQVTSFKLTGKRLLKMSPIHHHFELSGFNEKGIFVLFVTTQLFFSGVAIVLLNI